MQGFRHFIWAVLLLLPVPAAAQEHWELQRDRDGIQVYTRAVEGSPYDAVRAVAEISNVRLSSLVALIEDAEACSEWADRCADSYLVEQLNETESLVYTHNDLPFPVKDRDVLAHVIWQQDPESRTVTMRSSATVGEMEEIDGRLRLTEASASWIFEPLANGKVRITNEAHINPGSALPGWVTNMLLVDTPFETMKAFLTEVRTEKYRDAVVSFVREI